MHVHNTYKIDRAGLLTMSCLELIDKCLFSLLLDGPGISTNDVWKQKKVKSGHDTPHLVL